jgi:NAD(P)-dependent dehydrogenase (short-subunit alcohol dehydrogenase family)
MDIEGAVAVVTGGASGIGRSTALELARGGAEAIVIADVNDGRAADVVAEIEGLGRKALAVHCDVARDEDVDRLAQEAFGAFEHVDILMNNAGVPLLGPPERIPMADWDWILQINLYGVIRGVRAFVPAMLQRGRGHVVNTASVAGLFAYSWDSIPYITSKFGCYGFTEGLALYLKPQGIGVSALCPGLVETNLYETARIAGLEDPSVWFAAMEDFRPVPADNIGPMVVDAIRADRFLILTHPEFADILEARGRDLEAAVADRIAGRPKPPEVRA